MIAPFTGDNPATVVALSNPGDAIVSLGTSTTLLLSIPPTKEAPVRFTTSHLLSHPTDVEAHIAMLCYKNGALAREMVRDQYADKEWSRYDELVLATPAGCNGISGYYFPLYEIIPPNVLGNFFFDASGKQVPEADVPATAHPRLILESQFLSMASRIQAILPKNAPPLKRLVLCGGGSANEVIRQLAADVFGMNVFIAGQQGAAEGGAHLARFAWWHKQHLAETKNTYDDMVALDEDDETKFKCVAKPQAAFATQYAGMIEK